MHLPYLHELSDRFEIVAISDLSLGLMEKVGNAYGIRARYADYHALLQTDLDAVLVLTSACHMAPVVAAAEAGKHILVEKPLCYSLQNADCMIEAADRNGVTLMVGYMKRYDPGYLYGQSQIQQDIADARYARVHDMAGPNAAFIQDTRAILRCDDVPADAMRHAQEELDRATIQAIGQTEDDVIRAYRLLLGLSSHDVTIMRGALGDPKRVLSTRIWHKGRFYASILDYGDDLTCLFDGGVMDLKKWDEEFTVQGQKRTIKISFPNPFLRNAPTVVTVWEIERGVYQEAVITTSYEEAFKRELLHFHECIVNRTQPLTSGVEARADMRLIIEMIGARAG
jgi:predicted dehydrogenase